MRAKSALISYFNSRYIIIPQNKHHNIMKLITLRISSLVLGATILALLGSNCRTVQGFGRDVEKTGDNIKDAAAR